MNTAKTIAVLMTLGAGTATAIPAAAADFVGLTHDRDLVTVDSERMVATGMLTVDGGGGRLLAIDVRPADGLLYGVFEDGTLATIDTATAVATPVAMLDTLPPAGVAVTADFNPAADRLRLMGSDGTSLRINVETGEVTEDGSHSFAAEDMHAEEVPNVIAGAYTNSYAGTEATQLFNIDATAGALLLQDPPNDGTLNVVGPLGIELDRVGFDILSDGMGGNEAWLMAGGTLYAVDLETGAASARGPVEGFVAELRDIAILPPM